MNRICDPLVTSFDAFDRRGVIVGDAYLVLRGRSANKWAVRVPWQEVVYVHDSTVARQVLEGAGAVTFKEHGIGPR